MRRLFFSLGGALALSIVIAGTALGAHCRNESKALDAGRHVDVIINGTTGAVSFTGTNARGMLRGGFADLWLDVTGDGIGDQLLCDDFFLASNHSPQGPAAGQDEGGLAALPPIIRGANPGGDGAGLTSC
jgi:hypothetical protein